MAVYPRLLDETAIGFPVIQYRETDWEFIRRLASRFGMAVYPETTLGGGKLTVDLPQTGNAESGMMAVYPRLLDETAIGFPVIQYRETDWGFIRRLASRFGMAVYPETTLGGGKLTVDLPQTGNVGELSCLGYTARIDRKFYQAGGEQEGRRREQYQTYEVRSMELRRVGDAVPWDGKQRWEAAS